MMRGLALTRTAATTSAETTRPLPSSGRIAEGAGVELGRPPSTVGALVLDSARRAGVALRWKRDGIWHERTYRELVASARAIAKGLIALGIGRGDRISILSDTRPEWTLVDVGAFCAGAVVAPIYQTNSAEECEYVLAHSGARAVFCEDAAQVAKVQAVRERCPGLEHVIAFDHSPAGGLSLDELIGRGEQVPDRAVDERVAAVTPDEIATLVYTSGTTGPPKACMLTHANIRSAADGVESRLGLESTNQIVFFLFLPLAHVYARGTEMLTLDLGGTLVYWTGDSERLLDDIREARPTHFASVPRIWEKIYTAATAGIAEQPWATRKIFGWALAVGHEVRERTRAGRRTTGPVLSLKHRLADRLVLSKVRGLFGGRLVLAMSGAAPIAEEVLSFFDACGVIIVEGWGMTETGAAGTVNTEHEWKLGTVGRPQPNVELRIAGDGELMMRAPSVMTGYYNNPEATAHALPGGWLATGDLASIDEDGFVRITGRKKDLIITSSGKNIAPTNIENALKENRWIAEAVVYGDRRPYLVALITLDGEEAPKLAEKLGVPADIPTMAQDERVRAEIGRAVDAVNERFARIEQIKRFAISEREFSQETGELTPTLKIKRADVYREYADVFERVYDR